MPFAPVDINDIQLDTPENPTAGVSSSFAPVDIGAIELDKAPVGDTATVDSVKSLGGGLERGAASTVMVLPNLLNQAVAGPQLLGRGIAEGVDNLIGISPQPRGELWQPFMGSEEVLHKLPPALQPHDATTAAGTAADLAGQLLGGIGAGKAIQAIPGAVNNAFAKRPDIPSAEDTRALASNSYAKAEQAGGVLKPHITDSFIDEAAKLTPQTPAARAVFSTDTPSSKLITNLQSGVRGKPLTLAEAQELDSGLGDMMASEVHPQTGKLTAEGNKLLKIQSALRDAIEKAQPQDIVGGKAGFDAWNEGRQLWATAAKQNDIERIINKASGADNPAIVLKNGFSALKNNPTRMRGFTMQERAAIAKAAKTGIITDALRWGGSRFISSVTGTAAGVAGGGPMGAVLGSGAGYAAGMPLRALANARQMGRANDVLQTIAKRPALQSIINPNPPPTPIPPAPVSILPSTGKPYYPLAFLLGSAGEENGYAKGGLACRVNPLS